MTVAQWESVALARGLGEHAAAWDALNHRLYDDHPMLSAAFVDGLLRHFGNGSEQLYSLRQGDDTLAMCVLRRESPWRWASFRPAQAQIGCMLLPDASLAETLVPQLPGWPLVLDLMCCDPMLTSRLARIGLQLRFPHATTMSVHLHGSFDDFWQARTPNLRKSVRQYEKRAEAAGPALRLQRVEDAASMASAVQRYGELENKGWKGRAGTAVAPGSVQARFYTELMQHEAAHGAAQVHELWLGDTLAASRLLVLGPRGMVILKTTFDESLARMAPGRLLLRQTLKWAFGHLPGKAVEFYTNVTRDQLAWATHWRAICDVRLHRNLVVEMLGSASRLLRRPTPPSSDPEDRAEVQVLGDLVDPPADVCALLREAELEHGVQVGLDWYRLLGQHVLAEQHEIRFFVLRLGGSAVAVLPLMRAHSEPGAVQSLTNYYSAYFTPALQPWLTAEDLLPLLQAVRREWPDMHTLTLAPLDAEGREFATLRSALELAGLVPFRYFRFGNWALSCRGQSWTDYLASRSGQLRSTLSRMGKRFAAQDGRFEIITDAVELPRALDAYETVYQNSWKQAEPYPGFIRALAHDCAARGQLRLGLAWLGDKPIAAQLWLTVHGRTEIVKVAYDEAYKALSVGSLLTAQLMQRVLDVDQVREVDYLIGDDTYKRQWMSHRRERWGIVAYVPRRWRGLTGMLRHLVGVARSAWRRPAASDGAAKS